jgi:hypothetical protein
MNDSRRRPRTRTLLPLVLSLLALAACSGPHKKIKIPEPRFIAVHRDVREVFAAYRAKDTRRMDLAFSRLGELNARPDIVPQGEPVRSMDLSPEGRFLVAVTGATLGGSRVLVFEAVTGKLLLGANGYATAFSPDDRWLACLQHRYATPEPGADVGSYEAVLLVDMGRVRGAEPDDATVFKTLVSDPHSRFMNARIEFIGPDQVRLWREKPPLDERYTLEGEQVKKQGRRWYWLWLH